MKLEGEAKLANISEVYCITPRKVLFFKKNNHGLKVIKEWEQNHKCKNGMSKIKFKCFPVLFFVVEALKLLGKSSK